jgi:hypothetical protein
MVTRSTIVRLLLSIVGTGLDLLGILWILQGTNILRSGFMAGHLQYAALGVAVVIVGTALLIWTNSRSRHSPSMG